MDFFVQGVNVLKILVTAIGAGLGALSFPKHVLHTIPSLSLTFNMLLIFSPQILHTFLLIIKLSPHIKLRFNLIILF